MSKAESGAAGESIPNMRSRLPWCLRAPVAGLRYQVYCRAYALACAVRLTLPDALQSDWLLAGIIHWAGALLLAVNGCVTAWLLCGLGASMALFTLSDQLTQSVYLLWCALAALSCWAGGSARRAERLEEGLSWAVRLGTMLVYVCASLHKLNADFFDPAVSCVNGGLGVLIDNARIADLGAWLNVASPWWPRAFIACELGVVLALWLRPAYGVLLAAALHLPLTIVFAPSFVFTMMSGWICFFSDEQLRALGRWGRRQWRGIAVVSLFLFAMSQTLFFPGRWRSDPDWCIKEAFVWLVWVWLFSAQLFRRSSMGGGGRGVWKERPLLPKRLAALVLVFVANALTPYLGVQFHHTGAMLSNLRIDGGCHNSLVFPVSWRLYDPYVRIDDIAFHSDRATEGSTPHVKARLWSLAALWRARRRWCRQHPEPLAVAGSYQGQSFSEADFCAEGGWRFGTVRMLGMRRFQTNLLRTCPQRCIH